jgi:4-hydroxy-3-methylbut-2-enyl diphosphate reductase IspH
MLEDESETYNIFISQLKDDDKEYNRFIGKLEASYDFQWKNHSIADETDNEQLKEQMKDVDVVVILSGMYSKNKNLIQQEIDLARNLEKPIVIIRPYGMENVPGSIEDTASEVVGWNTSCIVDSVRESLELDDI